MPQMFPLNWILWMFLIWISAIMTVILFYYVFFFNFKKFKNMNKKKEIFMFKW